MSKPANSVFFLHQLFFAGLDIHSPNVVIFRIAIVQADENFLGKLVADRFDLGPHFLIGAARRQVFDFARVEIDGLDVKIFVPFHVLRIQDVPIRVGPEVAADRPILFLRHRLGRGRIVDRADPDVQHAIDRRQIAQPLAVVAHPGHRLVGIAEQHFARNEARLVSGGGRGRQKAFVGDQRSGDANFRLARLIGGLSRRLSNVPKNKNAPMATMPGSTAMTARDCKCGAMAYSWIASSKVGDKV